MSPEAINGIFGFLGVITGGTIAYFSSIHSSRVISVRKAGNDLRAAFAPPLAAIRLDQDKSAADTQKIFQSSIDTLTIEMEKFRFYVAPKDKPAYDKACNEYQDIVRIRDMNYTTLGGKKPFKVFEAKIDVILAFTAF